MAMAVSLILLPAIFVVLFPSFAVSDVLVSPVEYETPSSCSDQGNRDSLACEVKEAKLQIARLESIVGERIEEVNAKIEYLSDCEKKIHELTTEIDRLKTALSSSKQYNSRANIRISALEDEIQLLWEASRKNNFEIYELEHKAVYAESRLKEVASEVEGMTEIVTEQWIQIQKLEQAVYMAEVRTAKAKKELWRRCPFVKFCMTLYDDFVKILKRIFEPYGSTFAFSKSRASQIFTSAKQYHHQLQDLIRHVMKSNELTAVLAHDEVVFFVTSAVVAFPLMTACMLLLSQFS